ncbi:MAG: hypothetical protein V7679_09455 [Parasphingorhabdus sp.]
MRTALNDVARATGMTTVAAESKITRQALYKALGPNGNMTLETLLAVLRAMGVRLSVSG